MPSCSAAVRHRGSSADIPNFQDALAWAEDGWRAAIPADGVEGPPAVYFGADTGQEPAEAKPAFDASQAPPKLMAHFKVQTMPSGMSFSSKWKTAVSVVA
jgi:hypothetical protein